jgi:hypothetical protein
LIFPQQTSPSFAEERTYRVGRVERCLDNWVSGQAPGSKLAGLRI